jgi:hypothetical protein
MTDMDEVDGTEENYEMVCAISDTAMQKIKQYANTASFKALSGTTWSYIAHYVSTGDADARLEVALRDHGLTMRELDKARKERKTAQQFTVEWIKSYAGSA